MSDPLRPGHRVLEGSTPEDVVFAYHERTKHHPHRFAASPAFMDWATQPDPFRRYQGAPLLHLPLPEPGRALSYWQLYVPGAVAPAPLSIGSVSLFLRYALSLTAWKRFGGERWSLRANPSSGNLHPTEGYAVLPALDGIHDGPAVHHYVPREHGLERRRARLSLLPARCRPRARRDAHRGRRARMAAVPAHRGGRCRLEQRPRARPRRRLRAGR